MLDHQLPPGKKLLIDQLSRELGCSISVVRESLFQLASERRVFYRPNRGFMVARLLS
ncbi:GntR family transcriptional regulator [Sulfobacillus harzensis]|uniref:GntR family transcriptional regulator n=1 Tax=Sulfobacillus harzensis TaxID=2729629 RepID=UPI003B8359D6